MSPIFFERSRLCGGVLAIRCSRSFARVFARVRVCSFPGGADTQTRCFAFAGGVPSPNGALSLSPGQGQQAAALGNRPTSGIEP